jgi:uncharacterized membrane protein
MQTPASIARHPIHPMLITIPIGLWIFSFVCDLVVYFAEGNETGVLWFMIGYWTMAGGLVGALLAAIPGLIDYLSMTDRRIKTLATTHLSLNLTVVALYGVNLWLRSTEPPDFLVGMGLSVVAIVLLAASGWIGAEMVHVHGVGVAGFAPVDTFEGDRATSAEPSATRLRHS